MSNLNREYRKAILELLRKIWKSDNTSMWRKLYTILKIYAEREEEKA